MRIEKYKEILENSEFYKKIYDGLNGRVIPHQKVENEILND